MTNPISEKQLKANRDNARKSTGPKTNLGKAISSRNATKHGYYSNDIVINSPRLKEKSDDYEKLVIALFNEFRPIGEFQEQLVFKIANCLWRSRRAIRAETAHINDRLTNLNPNNIIVDINIKSIPDDYYSRLILRYEMRLDRQLSRYYRMLMNNQKLQLDFNPENKKNRQKKDSLNMRFEPILGSQNSP